MTDLSNGQRWWPLAAVGRFKVGYDYQGERITVFSKQNRYWRFHLEGDVQQEFGELMETFDDLTIDEARMLWDMAVSAEELGPITHLNIQRYGEVR